MLAFQGCWLACVWGAASAKLWLGPAAVGLWIIGHRLWFVEGASRDLWVVVGAMVVGFAVDSTLIATGLITIAPSAVWGAGSPVWLIALWGGLGLTVRHSLGWLMRRPLVAGLLGAPSAMLAYSAGEALGALTVNGYWALAGIGAAYAVAMPVLGLLALTVEGQSATLGEEV